MTPDAITHALVSRGLLDIAVDATPEQIFDRLRIHEADDQPRPTAWEFDLTRNGWYEQVNVDLDHGTITHFLWSPNEDSEADVKQAIAKGSKAWRAALKQVCGAPEKLTGGFVKYTATEGWWMSTMKSSTKTNMMGGHSHYIKSVLHLRD